MKKSKNTNPLNKMEHWKAISIYLLVYDVIAINFAFFFGLWLRFDLQFSKIPQEYFKAFLEFAPVYTVFTVAVFAFFHLYNSLWRFASFNELTRLIEATLVTGIFHVVAITIFVKRMPLSYYIIGICMQFGLTTMVRFGYRFINLERTRKAKSAHIKHNVMVIGAGAAGMTVLRELRSSRELDSLACCIIDDNPNKWNRLMEGVPIVGGRDSILQAVEQYDIDMIMFAIPSASPQEKRDILNICKETHCELKSLPGIYQMANGDVLLSKMKPVAVEDLLGRDTIKVNMDEIFSI